LAYPKLIDDEAGADSCVNDNVWTDAARLVHYTVVIHIISDGSNQGLKSLEASRPGGMGLVVLYGI